MRNRYWTIALSLCMALTAVAQKDPDSLRYAWHDRTNPDSLRLQALYFLIMEHVLYSDPDSAYVLAGIMYKEGVACSRIKAQAEAVNIQALSRYMSGDPAQALELFERNMAIHRSAGDSGGVAVAYYNMAMVHRDRGDLSQAMDCALNSLKKEEAIGRTRNVAKSHNLIGVIYMTLEDNANALDSYRNSLALCEQLGDSGQVAVALMNIAQLENLCDRNEQALVPMERAMAIFQHKSNDRDLAAANRTLGQILESLGRTDEALAAFERALGLQEKLGDVRDQARSLANISSLLCSQGHYGPAKEQGLQALTYARKAEDISGVEEAAECLYNANKALGLSAQALEMHELMAQMDDSLHSEENERGIMQAKYTYDLDKKEALANAEFERRQVATLLELERTRSQRMFILLAVLFIAAISALLVNRYRLKRRLQVAQLRTRLARDLHDDIGSTLSSINILSNVVQRRAEAIGDVDTATSLEKISERSHRLMREMSDIVWSVDPGKDSMADLIGRMREFGVGVLEPKGIAFHFNAPENAVARDLPVDVKRNLYLIFKEAVNNAAKHAEARSVFAELAVDGQSIRVQVDDDGRGMLSDERAAGLAGNGLRNMRERAIEIGAAFSTGVSEHGGARVAVVLSLA
ncbi:MAG: tetratricopeptide repeat protein [Flavobacteriales bacterium]